MNNIYAAVLFWLAVHITQRGVGEEGGGEEGGARETILASFPQGKTNKCLLAPRRLVTVRKRGSGDRVAVAASMVFVENGRVVERRSMMRAGTISDVFWGLLNTIYCFFHCMISVNCRKCRAPLPRRITL